MSYYQDLQAKFETLIEFVRTATENPQGADINVEALGLQAAQLCEAVENANPAIAQQVRPLMAQLIQDLDGLAMTLENKT